MRREVLTEDMKADGAALLELASELGMRPAAAAWLYGCDFGEWRYYLVTPLVDDLGRKAVYEGLDLALSNTAVAERMSVVDVHLAGSGDPVAHLLASLAAGTAPPAGSARQLCCTATSLRAHLYAAPEDHHAEDGGGEREQAFWHSLTAPAERRAAAGQPDAMAKQE